MIHAFLSILSLCILGACAQMPQFFDAVKEIETDKALYVEVDKEAFQKQTNVHINIDVINEKSVQARV